MDQVRDRGSCERKCKLDGVVCSSRKMMACGVSKDRGRSRFGGNVGDRERKTAGSDTRVVVGFRSGDVGEGLFK